MTQVETLYRWLAGDVRPATNEILAAALAHAERPYATCLALSGEDDPGLRQRLDRLSLKLFGTGLPAEMGDDAGPE